MFVRSGYFKRMILPTAIFSSIDTYRNGRKSQTDLAGAAVTSELPRAKKVFRSLTRLAVTYWRVLRRSTLSSSSGICEPVSFQREEEDILKCLSRSRRNQKVFPWEFPWRKFTANGMPSETLFPASCYVKWGIDMASHPRLCFMPIRLVCALDGPRDKRVRGITLTCLCVADLDCREASPHDNAIAELRIQTISDRVKGAVVGAAV